MELLYFLESLRTPFLDKLMQLITNLGGEMVFLVLAIVIFWCVDKKCGYYIMTTGFFGTLINQFLKITFRIARPWVLDPDFTIVESARAEATGYSFPSGHTQTVFSTVGAPAVYWRKRWFFLVAGVLIVFTAFSRMYLGVHTPLDVGVSFLVGLVLIFAMYPLFRDMDEKPERVYGLYWVFIALSAAFVAYIELFPFPADTAPENFVSASQSAYMLLFCAAGLMLTFHLDRTKIRFDTRAVWWAQLLKIVVGLGIVLAIRMLLKAPLNALFGGHAIAKGLRYFLMVVFAGCVWPLTFGWFSRLGKKQ